LNTDQFSYKYSKALESWILFSDWIHSSITRKQLIVRSKIRHFIFESSLVQNDSKTLIKVTAFLIALVFGWLLVSCQTIPRKRISAQRGTQELSQKQSDPIYIKRETLSIKPRFEGSTTGSIWADSLSPRQLIAEPKPQKAGEMVTINLPESLRFGAQNASPAAPASAANPKQSANSKSKPKPGDSQGQNPMPAAQSLLANTSFEELSHFKMQIVALEPQGDAFLKGTKSFSGPDGELRTFTLLAKLPSQNINSYELNAESLGEISLVESQGSQSSEYIASGWDTTISRKLSGWLPDLEAQAEIFDGEKKELEVLKNGIKDQQKSILQERERMISERKRNNEQMAKIEEAYQKGGAQGNTAGAQNSPGMPSGKSNANPAANPAASNGAAPK
jgi:hypothetical protein